jgi:hypothetical protein
VLAVAIVFAAATMAFGIFGLVTSVKLHHHLQSAYREKHRHPRKEGDFDRGFDDVIRFHRYVWSHEDDDDARVHGLRRQIRFAMVGGLVSGILAFVIPVSIMTRIT